MRLTTTRITKKVSEISSFGLLRRSFWPKPVGPEVQVNIDKSRSLYRNTETDTNLAAGFTKRIINCVPEFMGLPYSATGDETIDDFVNQCIETYWTSEIGGMVRDACRESKVVVRFRKASTENPLVSADEREAGYIEIVPSENVEIFYDPNDATRIDRAFITHEIEMMDEEFTFQSGQLPRTTRHVIVEEITPKAYTYFDQTAGKELTSLSVDNTWNFVPLVEVFNEYEAYLQAGHSDLEPVYVFLRAFHDVMAQTLVAHKQHSIPKATFNINEIQTFLMNNYPDSFEKDGNGNPLPGTFSGQVSWKGMEIIFLQPEEKVGFLEAKSVLGDSQNLLAFLLDCIVIASETPKWVLMMDVGAADRTETLTFIKRIDRKRRNFTPYIQQIIKMALATSGDDPVRVKLEWPEIDPQMLVTASQALQQETMSLELASERQLISDRTARERLRRYLPNMKAPEQEAQDAKSNVQLTAPANSPTGRDVVPASLNGNPQ